MTTIQINGGIHYTDKRLVTVPSDNLTTGTRHYSLYALANLEVDAARTKRHEAYVKWQADGTKESYAAYTAADDAFKKLVDERDGLQPNHSRDTDGTNDSLKGSLMDAGQSLDGRF